MPDDVRRGYGPASNLSLRAYTISHSLPVSVSILDLASYLRSGNLAGLKMNPGLT